MLSVVRRGITPEGNLQWRVDVVPDATLFRQTSQGFGGAIAIEIGFHSPYGGKIIAITPDVAHWPLETPGLNPFTGQTDRGAWMDEGGRAFLSLGSTYLLDDRPVAVATFITEGGEPSQLAWGGYTLLPDTPFEFAGGRISQQGMNFDGISGLLEMRLGDLDADADVDSSDLLSLLSGWTGAQAEPDPTITFASGDMDGDFDVDSSDLLVFLSGWTGASAGRPAAAVVPEPRVSWVWFATAVGCCCRSVRMRSAGTVVRTAWRAGRLTPRKR
jgi:hypothetical protein